MQLYSIINVPFHKSYMTGHEVRYIAEAMGEQLAGDGPFGRRCEAWLERTIGCHKALLTPSCTSALEMAAMLIGTSAGDEIIMPSFTFVSTANAFALFGGVPVFVDIRPDTLCIDIEKIRLAITPRTKAIVVVHYAGIACDMDAVMELAAQHQLVVIEDAAHALLAEYRDRKLGSIGHLATLSFHESKNITCGEGGALLINAAHYVEPAQIIRQKGTNRTLFEQKKIRHYSWEGLGSSHLMSEISAAFLWAQLEQAEAITAQRMAAWQTYRTALPEVASVRYPVIPPYATHNAHIYFAVLPSMQTRDRLIAYLKAHGVPSFFHYVPLHTSNAGRRYGRTSGALPMTEQAGSGLLRLPLWAGAAPHVESIASIFVKGVKECMP